MSVTEWLQHAFQAFRPYATITSTHFSTGYRKYRYLDVLFCLLIALVTKPGLAASSHSDEDFSSQKVILLINPAELLSPSAQASDQGMYKVFSAAHQATKILSEHLHLDNDSSLEHDSLALIQKKYQGLHIDLIIARGEEVLKFLEPHGKRLWPNVPVLYFSVSDTSPYWGKPPLGKSGVFMMHNYADNLALISQLQPNVKRIIQITNTEDSARLQRELSDAATKINADLIIETMPAMTQRARLEYVSELPKDTALLALNLNSASDDVFYAMAGTMRNLSDAASVPIYGMHENFIGNGVVGGYFIDPAEHGRQTAALALQMLANPGQAPVIELTKHLHCAVDEIQLLRWKLTGASRPADCNRLFYVQTFWDLHGNKIIAGMVVGILLLILSLALNLQWIRRRRAEEETKRQRTALAHVARLGSVGELTASIVHEINQPLGAILTNADAATMMLKQHSSTDEELSAILDDIREDNLRASRIIQKLRTLLSKRSLESVALSLNDVITSCKSLLGNMTIRHHAVLVVDLADELPPVMGDTTHLQQVLINLVSNGMEAMSALPPPERRLTVTTKVGNENTVQLIVTDNGPGISPDVLAHMFESFYTTKPDGMGMGLAIIQTIIDVHGGSIEVRNGNQGGAIFTVTLPCLPVH